MEGTALLHHLSGKINGNRIENANVAKVVFSNSNLTSAEFEKSNLSNAYINTCILEKLHIKDGTCKEGKFEGLNKNLKETFCLFKDCALSKSKFVNCDFSISVFESCSFEGATFNGIPLDKLVKSYSRLRILSVVFGIVYLLTVIGLIICLSK